MVLMDVNRDCSCFTLSISCFFGPICFTSSEFLRFFIIMTEFDDFAR